MSDEPGQLRVESDRAGERLDRLLSEVLGKARNQIQGWIRDDRVLVNGRPAKASQSLNPNDQVEWTPPTQVVSALEAEPGDLVVIWEDSHMVMVNKPAGIVVHPGAGRPTGTLVQRLLARYPEMAEVGGIDRPGVVHRLDIDTTGVLVVARTAEAHLGLTRAFEGRSVDKRYLAICYGSPSPTTGLIDRPLGRHPRHRKRITVRADGRPARTGYRTLGAAKGISLLEIELITGRTHQIRVHLKAIGHPLIGDPTYGEARWKGLPGPVRAPLKRFNRPALHSWRLELSHPVTGKQVRAEAPLPDDMQHLWQHLADAAPPLEPWRD